MDMNAKSFLRDCTTFNVITTNGTKIVIYLTCSPKPSSIEKFSQFMKDKGVTDVFCFCNYEYDEKKISDCGIEFHHLFIEDGMHPDLTITKNFDMIVDEIIKNKITIDNSIIINMQCQSGLGRAPTMIAYLTISRCGYRNSHSISMIRSKRRGAINLKQVKWILDSKFKKISIKENFKCYIL